MSSKRDRAADLAAEIRAAIAETAVAPRDRGTPESGTGDEESARAAIERAEAHVTPTVPEGVRFSRAKRLLLRGLRFLWREQASFNALTLESSHGLLRGLASLQSQLLKLCQDIEHWEESTVAARERRAAIQDARLATLESAGPRSPEVRAPSGASLPPTLTPGVYSLFEERFRGSPQEIADKQRFYLSFLKDIPGPVFEVGCGRGEFLELLRAKGIRASGVDINPIAVAGCRERGLEVEADDGLEALSRQAAESLGAVVAFQVVEHWSAEATFAFLREARRTLASGGVLIAETINTDSLSALKAFYLDPSHVRPVPPEALKFLAEAAGFADARIEYRAPLSEQERLAETSENERKLNRLLFGPQDYALIARVPDGVKRET